MTMQFDDFPSSCFPGIYQFQAFNFCKILNVSGDKCQVFGYRDSCYLGIFCANRFSDAFSMGNEFCINDCCMFVKRKAPFQ